jgi:uncharacterized membrane protein YdjX (TVP38/TMEM64 family)
MSHLRKLRDAAGAEGFAAAFISATYLLLGVALLALSPVVGMVLLVVGVATFGVFVALKRLTCGSASGLARPPARSSARAPC